MKLKYEILKRLGQGETIQKLVAKHSWQSDNWNWL